MSVSFVRTRQESKFERAERNLLRKRDAVTPDVFKKNISDIINDNDNNFLDTTRTNLLSQPRHVMQQAAKGNILQNVGVDNAMREKPIKETMQSSIKGDGVSQAGSNGMNLTDADTDLAVKLSRRVDFPRFINRRRTSRQSTLHNDVELLQTAIANFRQKVNTFNVLPRSQSIGNTNQFEELFPSTLRSF